MKSLVKTPFRHLHTSNHRNRKPFADSIFLVSTKILNCSSPVVNYFVGTSRFWRPERLYMTLFILTIPFLIPSCKKSSGNLEKSDQLLPIHQKSYNVLFIVVDDLRPLLGAYGVNYIHSPNIDTLAAKGLKFESAYAQAPICSPSRMSILTGVRPHESDLTGNSMQLRDKLPDIQTLPQLFKQQGYQSRAHGKVFHQGNGDSLSWDHYDDSPRQRTYNLSKNIAINDASDGAINRGRPYEAADVPDSLYTDGMITNRALKELDTFSKDRPFFLAVGLLKPHLPFNAPRKYWDLYGHPIEKYKAIQEKPVGAPRFAFQNSEELRKYHSVPKEGAIRKAIKDSLTHGYMACISYADAQVGKLLNKLKAKGYTDNTIVVLMGDHGYHLGDFNDWCKNTQYELDTRVPFIIYHPDRPSGVVTQTVELLDLYPTLVDLTGLQAPNHELSGQSLSPLFDDMSIPLKNFALSENKRMKLIGLGLTDGRYRLIEWRNRKNKNQVEYIELYDLKKSNHEQENLAKNKDYDSIVRRMQLKIKEVTRKL